MDDLELLSEFATRNSEAAFSALVSRHLNLVYSAARRLVRDQELAEEITQAVFLVLARKAKTIRRGTVLAGWLFRTTKFTAANARRRELRRRHYEQQAMQNTFDSSSDPEHAWECIAPLLDEALAVLGEKDRNAILLRFFENKSFREIGAMLNTTDDNAQKRVSRALDKMRECFLQRGHAIPAAVLATLLVSHSMQAAPTTLAGSITASLAFKGGIGTGTLALLCEQTVSTLDQARFALMTIRAAAVLLICAMLFWFVSEHRGTPAVTANVQNANQSVPQGNVVEGKAGRKKVAALALPSPVNDFAFRVTDSMSGAPIVRAKLTLEEAIAFSRYATNEFATGEDGIGKLPRPLVQPPEWNYRVTVFKDGYVPKYVSWSRVQGDRFEEIPASYDLMLDRAVVIGGTVVEPNGEPIPNVDLVFNVSPPAPADSQARERLTFAGGYHREKTDERGVWSCSHVPAKFGMIYWSLIREGYQSRSYEVIAPENDLSTANTLHLPKEDFVLGRAKMVMMPVVEIPVTNSVATTRPSMGLSATRPLPVLIRFELDANDAETKMQIDDFQVVVSETLKSGGASMVFTPRARTKSVGGKAVFTANARVSRLDVEVRANGYLPGRTNVIISGTNDVGLSLELRKGLGITGLVRNAEGNPAVGATAAIASMTRSVYVRSAGQLLAGNVSESQTETDAEGRFVFTPRTDVRAVLIANRTGFGMATIEELQKSEIVVIHPWGRIEGTFAIANTSSSNQIVHLGSYPLSSGQPPVLAMMMKAQSGDDGHFVFEGVPPGVHRLWYQPASEFWTTGLLPLSHDQPVTVNAGETTSVMLGGTGREVVGRVTVGAVTNAINWRKDIHRLTSKLPAPGNEAGASFQKQYVPLFDVDGRFQIHDVSPGTYWLEITPQQAIRGSPSLIGIPLGELKVEVVVPHGDRIEPVDLGTFELKRPGR